MMRRDEIKRIVEAVLLAADEPVGVDRLVKVFAHGELPTEKPRAAVRQALTVIGAEADGRGYELAQVASGFRLQVRQELSPWVNRLFDERPPRYSRALLETLALIVYRQPVTRGDIEQVRGVSVSQSIIRTLLERGWIRAVGQRETPGRPTMYGTTRTFLDYFNLRSLDELPPLAEIESFLEQTAVAEEATPDDAPAPQGEEQDKGARPLAEVVQLPIAGR